MGTTLTFGMPQGWTVQPVVGEQGEAVAPLWKRGISTAEYESG